MVVLTQTCSHAVQNAVHRMMNFEGTLYHESHRSSSITNSKLTSALQSLPFQLADSYNVWQSGGGKYTRNKDWIPSPRGIGLL